MKKIVLITLIITAFLLTGCGRKMRGDFDLKKYLYKTYPGERFEIINREIIDISGDVGGCDNPGKGYSYTVRSLDSNNIFTVKDDYHFNSFVCEYRIEDDYLEIAQEKFINDNSMYKVDTYYHCYKCLGIKFEKERYENEEEMKNSVWIVINKLNNIYPFKHRSVRLNADISIDSEENINPLVNIKDLNNKEKTDSLVENLYR